jgi:hypothetical protein
MKDNQIQYANNYVETSSSIVQVTLLFYITITRFVIVENLRYMLNSHDPNKPVHFGCKFKPFVKQGYMSGGAGNPILQYISYLRAI